MLRVVSVNKPHLSAKSKKAGLLPHIWLGMRLILRFTAYHFALFFIIPLLCRWERGQSNKTIADTKLQKDPVFILGHWRSGTTFLHYLMACDPQFGVMTNFYAFFPWFMDAGPKYFIRGVFARFMPGKRWDNMKLTPDSPQEEEFALHRLFGASAYAGWYFPMRLRYFFEKYVLLNFDNERARHCFGQQYRYIVNKLAIACSGKQLLLKNPPNTGRVRLLLELFPNARFIYLSREPSEVYYSTIRMHEQLLSRFAVVPFKTMDLSVFVPALYARLIGRYKDEKTLIPTGNLIEVTYEQLIRSPEQTLETIYETLHLPGYSDVLPAIRTYLNTQKNFQSAVYQFTPSERMATARMMKTGKRIISPDRK